jgi:hypothetical protein
MWRRLCLTWIAAAALGAGGCATGPLQDNPLAVHTEMPLVAENPAYVPLGWQSYPLVFEKVLDVVDDYFEVAWSSRHSGIIETLPAISPGLGQPWKPGSPDLYQRTLASFQTIRERAVVRIVPADETGFFIDVKVFKEMEDLPNPARYTAGSASFRSVATVERQYEVVEAGQFEGNWIPYDRCGKIWRDYALEQVILSRIAQFDISGMRPAAAANCPPKDCPPAPRP